MESISLPEGKCLVNIITEMLTKHGHPEPMQWEQFVHKDAFVSPDQGIQRFLINRYWRECVGLFPENTIQVRHCLIDQGSIADWLRLFEQGVIPCIIRNIQHKPTF